MRNSDFKNLFVHPLLTPEVKQFKHISYHALKSKLIQGYKCVLNRRNNKYELRNIINSDGSDVIDWSGNPYIPCDNTFNEWKISFNSYISDIKNKSSDPQSA